MNINYEFETIAAIATPPGTGGVGIVRVSGEKAFEIVQKIFQGKTFEAGKICHGWIAENDKKVDEVVVLPFKNPHSYTGEDVVEIQGHGGLKVVNKILELVLKNGARMAQKGEFTKRAFLNHKMDLSQAEAVLDLIHAKTDNFAQKSANNLSGALTVETNRIKQNIFDLMSKIIAAVDFPDDVEEPSYGYLKEQISDNICKIEKILEGARNSNIMRQGIKVAIAGCPNAGKSSLFNTLLNLERAIVTEFEGTTRDTIEETLVIRDIPVVLTDTAGIRDTDDTIERIGIEKSKEAFNRSDLVIFVIDASRPLERDDMDIIRTIGDRKVIVLLNKTDKGIYISEDDIKKDMPNACVIKTSLINGEGTETLAEVVENLVYGGHMTRSETNIVTNARHKALLQEASGSMKDAVSMIIDRQPLELIEIDVNHGYEALGEITGQTAVPDIIDRVFERFCLGK